MKKRVAGEIVGLVLFQFILNVIFVSLYPEIVASPLRAGIMGSIAFIVFLVGGAIRGSYTYPLVGTASLFSSWYFVSLLVAKNAIMPESVVAALSYIGVLVIAYFILGFAYRKLSEVVR